MGKHKFQAGETWDVLNKGELKAELEAAIFTLRAPEYDLVTVDTFLQIPAGATAIASPGLAIYTVPEGYEDVIHRIAIGDATYTPGAPLTAPSAFFACFRQQVRFDRCVWFTPQNGSAVIPAIYTEGRMSAAVLRGGESLIGICNGFPTADLISVGVQVARKNMNPGTTPEQAQQ